MVELMKEHKCKIAIGPLLLGAIGSCRRHQLNIICFWYYWLTQLVTLTFELKVDLPTNFQELSHQEISYHALFLRYAPTAVIKILTNIPEILIIVPQKIIPKLKPS